MSRRVWEKAVVVLACMIYVVVFISLNILPKQMIVYGGPNRSKPLDLGFAFGFPVEFANGIEPTVLKVTEVNVALLCLDVVVLVGSLIAFARLLRFLLARPRARLI